METRKHKWNNERFTCSINSIPFHATHCCSEIHCVHVLEVKVPSMQKCWILRLEDLLCLPSVSVFGLSFCQNKAINGTFYCSIWWSAFVFLLGWIRDQKVSFPLKEAIKRCHLKQTVRDINTISDIWEEKITCYNGSNCRQQIRMLHCASLRPESFD